MSASGKIYNRDNLIDSFNGYSESKKSNALYYVEIKFCTIFYNLF